MDNREAVRILTDEIKVIEAMIAYSENFGEGDAPAPGYRRKRKEALEKAVSIMEEAGNGPDARLPGSPEGDTTEKTGDGADRPRVLEEYNNQLRWERDTAIQQLEEIGVSLGAEMDPIREAVEKQTPEPCVLQPAGLYPGHNLYFCPSCGHEIKRSDNDGMVQLVKWPRCCPKCGKVILWETDKLKENDDN